MAESRLQRWSRRKAEAGKTPEPTAPPSITETGPSPEERKLAINEALPEQGVLEKYDLPDPDSIELGTDITGFMGKEIPELLRRKALRALWRSNPVLAVLDGLNDYDEDFSDTATAVNGIQTLYKVGQGLIDKTSSASRPATDRIGEESEARAGIKTETRTENEAGTSETMPPAGESEDSETEVAAGASPTTRQAEPEVARAETETAGNETEPAPRYRPRMHFE